MHDSHVQEAAYDAFLYPDDPHFWSEPGRFSAAAVLHGFQLAKVARARVLEIGCASGGNIIPMAARYPQATFYGFDISGKQIEAAKRHADEIGLPNLTLVHANITGLPSDIGTFDYIIGHGICSWVPHPVRLALWEVCNRLLREDGLLYLSYNTLPGWHFKKVVRDLFRFRVGEKTQTHESLLDVAAFFKRIEAQAKGIYKHLLDIEKQFITDDDVYYIRHEYLEEENHAFYVQDILREAADHNLTYVCEADSTSSNLALFPAEISEHIIRDSLGQRSMEEQYIDFHINRSFRRSVFAKYSHAKSVKREIAWDTVDQLHIEPLDVPFAVTQVDGTQEFLAFPPDFFAATKDTRQLQKQSVAAQALTYLQTALPATLCTITAGDVLTKLHKETQGDPELEHVVRLSIFELLYRRKFCISTEHASWSQDLERPRLQHLLRSDALHGRSSSTNVLHEKITLTSDQSRLVMSLLDGNHDRKALAARLVSLLHEGRLVLDHTEARANAPESIEKRVSDYLDVILEKIANLKLLL